MSVESRHVLRPLSASSTAQLGGIARRAAAESAAPIILGAAYYVGCLLGFALRFPSSGISFLWPPNAILLTGFLIVAPRAWPGILAGAFLAHGLAHGLDGIPVSAWSIQFSGNAVQALLAAIVVRRFGSVEIHKDFRGALVFVVGACILAPAVASVPSAYIYVSLGWATDFFAAWRARAASNAIATLAVVPSLLFVWYWLARRPVMNARRAIEFVVLLLALVASLAAAYSIGPAGFFGVALSLYAITPLLVWATVRFGGAGLSLALSATLLIISKTASGMSSLTGSVPADAIIAVQLLLTANAVPLMLLAGLLRQQRAEHHTLVDLEQQNRAILRTLPDTTLLHTREGGILQSYPAAIEDAVMGRGSGASAVPPAVVENLTAHPGGIDDDEPRVTEYTEVRGDTARRYEARSVAVDDERVLSIIRDITERWQSEQALRDAQQRYALAIGAGVIGVWHYDESTGGCHVEGTLRAALGYQEHEIRDTLADWQSVIFEPDREELQARLAAAVAGGDRTLEAEFRVVHRDGSLRWISSKGALTPRTAGEPARFVGTYADVTERKGSTRALSEANDTLARLGRIAAMSEVTASIAHELNQPLTAITANVLACLRALGPQPQTALRDALEDVRRESELATQIVARTQSLFANRSTQHTTVNLNDVVRDVLKVATPRLRELGVRVSRSLDADVPGVHADVVQMQQVLFNLLTNAADALQDVGADRRLVRISTRHSRKHVFVSVRDSGVGLDQADVSRLFEPFYTTKTSGIGMGLTISRSIVRTHGGTLWTIANTDGGATFRFKLPRVFPATSAGAVPRHGRRVLIVDDHRGIRRSLTRLLTGCGHQVAGAASGTRALAVVPTFRPDAVVIDLSLGDMTGIELATRLRSFPSEPRLLLIALTAGDDDDMRHACVTAGFDVYLSKHKHIAELEAVLGSLR